MDRPNLNYNQAQHQDRRDLQMQYRNLPEQTAFPGRPVIPGQPGQQVNFPVQMYQQQQTSTIPQIRPEERPNNYVNL
ncbi:18405_t:CDS:2, partial [Funneliformis geosporum]